MILTPHFLFSIVLLLKLQGVFSNVCESNRFSSPTMNYHKLFGGPATYDVWASRCQGKPFFQYCLYVWILLFQITTVLLFTPLSIMSYWMCFKLLNVFIEACIKKYECMCVGCHLYHMWTEHGCFHNQLWLPSLLHAFTWRIYFPIQYFSALGTGWHMARFARRQSVSYTNFAVVREIHIHAYDQTAYWLNGTINEEPGFCYEIGIANVTDDGNTL